MSIVSQQELDGYIAAARHRYGDVPAAVIRAFVQIESSGRTDAHLAEAGGDDSVGLMQVRLSTARGVGYGGTLDNLYLPPINVYYGTAELDRLARKFGFDWDRVASAYNGGDRPSLGFGTVVTKETTVCLRRDPTTGKCIKTFTAQPGQFGNQPYVDAFRKALHAGSPATIATPTVVTDGAAPQQLADIARESLSTIAPVEAPAPTPTSEPNFALILGVIAVVASALIYFLTRR